MNVSEPSPPSPVNSILILYYEKNGEEDYEEQVPQKSETVISSRKAWREGNPQKKSISDEDLKNEATEDFKGDNEDLKKEATEGFKGDYEDLKKEAMEDFKGDYEDLKEEAIEEPERGQNRPQ
ncbi:hypothetical protein scyTo_0015994 [Scyliorhinus torazame]|uniref:Uncharacterized protein n=1 Tax=Scyliorhinus torazame TaxID=75743 RepID=A0A401Q2D5_SCYTO|nr:hypothetical protein [Scyliorhinus torazame]